jgi:hypothetical protein
MTAKRIIFFLITSFAIAAVLVFVPLHTSSPIQEEVSQEDFYAEFLTLKASAMPLQTIQASTRETPDGTIVCEASTQNNCLLLKSGSEIKENAKQTFRIKQNFHFIEPPQEGVHYIYPQLTDMDLVVLYRDAAFIAPNIPYLKGWKSPYETFRTDTGYRVFASSEGDVCFISMKYMINPNIQGFPYWIETHVDYETCDASADTFSLDRNYVQHLNIKKL